MITPSQNNIIIILANYINIHIRYPKTSNTFYTDKIGSFRSLYSFYYEQKSCFINYTNTDCLHFPNWPELKDLNFSVGARIATQRELCPNSVGQVSWRLKENKFNFILSSLQAEF